MDKLLEYAWNLYKDQIFFHVNEYPVYEYPGGKGFGIRNGDGRVVYSIIPEQQSNLFWTWDCESDRHVRFRTLESVKRSLRRIHTGG